MDITALCNKCEAELREQFSRIDSVCLTNTARVLNAFRTHKVSDSHFAASSGYGYDDGGRDVCDKLFADVFEAPAGFARHNIVSGTHALTIGLFGLLRPGDTLYSVTGSPYDTLHGVIGITPCDGSLAEYGVRYEQTTGFCDVDEITAKLRFDPSVKVVFIQRSRGYMNRRTLSAKEIGKICEAVHSVSDAFVMVDNCYGEFCEEHEPTYYGADLCVGSLIKNPGGGIAETGGYAVGTEKAVLKVASRLTTPGIGLECGASLGQTKSMIKGLFFAPHTVAQALKSAVLASKMLTELGFETSPTPEEERFDIIQTLTLRSPEKLCRFCEGIQSASPVDSFVTPIPWAMPGYGCDVIMAAGAFTQGSSIELSADAPMREPYTVFMQGGLTYESAKLAICTAIGKILA